MRAILATLFLAVVACGTEADLDVVDDAESAALTYKCGDVNFSGAITVTDAVMAGQFATGAVKPTADQKWAADVNASGTITQYDADQIQRAAAGLSASLKCGLWGPITK